MGLQKVAFNFMVERGGKLAKSLLCSKPVKQYNISELGVCISDSSIHFQTEKSAIKYIKNRLINSLNRPTEQQFERGIYKEGSTIVAQGDGNSKSCFVQLPFDKLSKMYNGIEIGKLEFWHSHPDKFGIGKTFPLSNPEGGDLYMFAHLNLKKIVAVNRNGEINSIERAKDYSHEAYKAFKDDFKPFYIKKLSLDGMFKKFQKLQDIINECKEKGRDVPESVQKQFERIQKLGSQMEECPKAASVLHEYYKTANLYGMKYFTDFSNL